MILHAFLELSDASLSGSGLDSTNIVPVCALVVSSLAFCVSIYTVWIGRRQKKIDNLVSLHLFLHKDELSNARLFVREDGGQMTHGDPRVRSVCSSFDFAGSLVRTKAVDVDMFFQYWATPLLTLKGPLSQIADEITGGVKVRDYYSDFWNLLDEAEKYKRATAKSAGD
jgi:hypothetical protein